MAAILSRARRFRLPRRTLFAGLAASASLLPLACREPTPAPRAERWNVLLVTLDTLRADRLGAYGRARAGTPHLDALAAAGARFDQAQAAAPLTLPSHATLLTGLLPPRHGLRDNGEGSLPADVPSLAEHLRAAGYRTGAFVGAFVLDRRYGLARGFERYDDEIPRVPGRLDAERPGSVVVDRALAWLAEPDPARRPFFAWVHLFDAHAPYAPPSPYAARFPGDPYQAEVALVDAHVGRLVAALRERGDEARTLVVVAGDHGESLGEHGELTHGLFLYQSTLRVPLLVVAPGVVPPRAVREPVGLADLAPTMAALLGVPLAVSMDGRDLSTALVAGAEPPRADLYAETRYPASFGWASLAAVRRNGSKFVEAPRPELYDLGADPGERRDLRGERRREAAELERALNALATPERSAAPAAEDAESRALLQSLGYAAPAAAPDAGAARDPKDAVALFRAFEEAHRDHGAGRLDEAAERLAPLVADDPRNPVFRAAYGRVLRDLGRLGEAVPLYREAAALAPRDPQVWYELATALQAAGEAEEARRALEQVLRHDPARPEAHNALAVTLAEAGRFAEARDHLQAALATDPGDARAWNNLGNVLRGLRRPAEAADAYRRAVELDPAYPDPLNGMGALEVARQRPAEALPWFDRALALAPGRHEARLNRAIALELAGDRAAAAAAYRDFLARVEGEREYAGQRQVAARLLARLEGAGRPH